MRLLKLYLDSDYDGCHGEDYYHGNDHVKTVQHLLNNHSHIRLDSKHKHLLRVYPINVLQQCIPDYLMLFLFLDFLIDILHIELLAGAELALNILTG